MNKSLITNILALSLTIYGMFSPIYSTEIFMAGLFIIWGLDQLVSHSYVI